MGMTIAEKILAKKSGRDRVSPGDLVTVKVDTVVLFDNNFMPSIWQDVLKLEHPERVVVILDHRVPAPTIQSAGAHRTARKFVEKFKIARFHDVGGTQGICHQVVADQGYALPGTVLVCSDSHTCSAGAFNCIARGVGGPMSCIPPLKGRPGFASGLRVRYELTGALRSGVTAKDVFLHIAGTYGDHATQNVEFGGSALAGLSISARKTLSTMGAELSCEFATFEADQALADYLSACGKTGIETVHPDADANYFDVRKIDLSTLEPLVALPDSVLKNSRPVAEVAGTPHRPGVHRVVRERHARRSDTRRPGAVRQESLAEDAAYRYAGLAAGLSAGAAKRRHSNARRGGSCHHEPHVRRLRRRTHGRARA